MSLLLHSLLALSSVVGAEASMSVGDTLPARRRGVDTPPVTVTVDSARKEVVITAGPWALPNMPPMESKGGMMMGHDETHDEPVQKFAWPVDGWFRGFRYTLVDAQGNPVPRHIMHHLIMVNFDRRQITYQAAERLMGAGAETDDAEVPKTIGVPLDDGTRLGMYIAWHNDTGKDLEGVYLKLTMLWTPTNQNPRPVNALPIYMDVNLTVGGSNTFDVVPGKSSKSWEFTVPMGGRLLGVGGHMHDFGSSVRLEDVETGKVLARVNTKRTREGKVLGVSRKLFGVTGEGLRIKANHRYRVVGEYDNPTGKTIVRGAMAHMVGLFTPDDLSKWPKIDPDDPTFQKDLTSLDARGMHGGHGDGEEEEHGDDEHDEGDGD